MGLSYLVLHLSRWDLVLWFSTSVDGIEFSGSPCRKGFSFLAVSTMSSKHNCSTVKEIDLSVVDEDGMSILANIKILILSLFRYCNIMFCFTAVNVNQSVLLWCMPGYGLPDRST